MLQIISNLAFNKALARPQLIKISSNRKVLASIIKTIQLCGHQNLPLCGHRDNIETDEMANHGNFWALLNFRVEAGDKILGDHLISSCT